MGDQLPNSTLNQQSEATLRLAAPKFRNLAWLSIGLMFLSAVVFWKWPHKTDSRESVTWMPLTESTSAGAATLTRLKFRLLRSSRRVWNWYTSTQKQILLTARFLGFAEGEDPLIPLAAPAFTNSDGMRAWILSPEQWSGLQKPGALGTVLQTVRISTMEGTDSSMATANLWMRVSPQVHHRKFDLGLKAICSTDMNSNGTASGGTTLTNLALACRVTLSDGGAVIINRGKEAGTTGTNYWFMLSPVAIDSKGNRKKL
jgi:hypothetical protein